MSELSLQEYQSRLEELLHRQRNDEVVQHCRHILNYFPKNVAIYRLMGRALLGSGRYNEAGQVFRRVLGVDPADYQAHLGLSRVAQNQKQGDQAIFHLERAFEQDPNNRALLDQLHELYRQHRGVEQTKFQLTARAVAAQQLRAGLYAQAIDTLNKALVQSPGRADLTLLLARVLWENGYTIEAAETALNILKTLPDCLDANRIMTQLWLKEQRPSDAQRYLSRIEAVDPYVAFDLAQGAPPPENAYRIAELDYQREASRQLATGNPDWLQSLENVEADDASDTALDDLFGDRAGAAAEPAAGAVASAGDDDWMSLMFEDNGAASSAASTDLNHLRDDSDDTAGDWMQELDHVQSAASEKTRSVSTDHLKITEDSLADLFGDDDAWMTDTGDQDLEADDEFVADDFAPSNTSGQPMSGTGLTGLLSNLGNRGTSTGLTGLLNVLEGGSAAEEPTEEEEEEDWMRAVNKPTAPLRDPFKKQTTSDLERKQAEEAAAARLDQDNLLHDDDPLAWLTRTDAEPVSTPVPGTDSLQGDENDPLAWMKQSGIEFMEDAPETMYNPTLDTLDDSRPISDPNENRPMAWMENSGIEFLDDGGPQFDWMVGGDDNAPPVKTDDLPTNQDPDPLAWMHEAGIELHEDDSVEESEDTIRLQRKSAPIVTDQPDEPGRSGKESTNALDWLGSDDQLDELLDLETMVEQGTGLLSTGEQDRQDAMTDDNDNLIPDWLSSGDNDDAPDDDTGDSGLEWLSASDDDSDAGLDWMRQPAVSSTPDADLNVDDLFGDLETDETADDEDALAEDVPDWLTSARPAATASPAQVTDSGAGDAGFDFDWDAEEDENEEAVADTGMPDWLSAMAAPQTGTSAGDLLSDDDLEDEDNPAALDWQMLDAELDEDEVPGAAASAMPDWLSSVGRSGLSEEPAEEEPIESDVPDWLTDTGTAPVVSTGAVSYGRDESPDTDDFDFSLDEDEEEPAVASDIPDWLSGIGAPAEAPSQAPAPPEPAFAGMFGSDDNDDEEDADTGFDFSLDLDEDEEEPAAASDIPDWLSGIGAPAEAQSAPEPSFGAMFSVNEEETVIDAFDFGLTADDADAEAEDFDFDFNLEDEEEPAAASAVSAAPAAAVPDWLSGIGASDEDEEEAAPEPAFAGMFGSDDNDDEEDAGTGFDFSLDAEDEEPAAVASDIPDWLSGIGASDEDEEEAAPEPAFAGMFGSDDNDDEEDAGTGFDFSLDAEDEEPAAIASEVPDWLSGIGNTDDEEAVEVDTQADNDDFRFDLDEEAEDETITADTPDWLAAVAPPAASAGASASVPAAESSLFDEEDANALDFSWEMEHDSDIEAVPAEELPVSSRDLPRRPKVTDLLSELEVDDSDESDVEEAAPSWLSGVTAVTGYRPSEPADADDLSADVPDWLAGIGSEDEEEVDYAEEPVSLRDAGDLDEVAESEFDWEAEPVAAGSVADLMGDLSDDNDLHLEEELAPTPASNAPDWLNAMVPGLDVDYAEGEAEAETPVAVEPAKPAPRSDYNWLTEIVDEELAPPVTLPPAAQPQPAGQPAAQAGARKPGSKFAFSHPPAWLRRLRGESEGSANAASAVQSEVMDEDDDLPPWLQFDSDGE